MKDHITVIRSAGEEKPQKIPKFRENQKAQRIRGNRKSPNSRRVRQSPNSRKSKFALRAVVSASAVLIFLLIILSVIGEFVKIGGIKVSGESVYGDDEIIRASEIEKGAGKRDTDAKKAGEKILSKCAYLSRVKVKISFFGNVKINVTCDFPKYRADIAGDEYILSKDFRVLGVYEEEKGKDTVRIKLPQVKRAFIGKKIVFYGDISFMENFLDEIYGSEYREGKIADCFDFGDRYGISVYVDARKTAKGSLANEYTIIFGDGKGTAEKLDTAMKIMTDEKLCAGGESVVIDLSDMRCPNIKKARK